MSTQSTTPTSVTPSSVASVTNLVNAVRALVLPVRPGDIWRDRIMDCDWHHLCSMLDEYEIAHAPNPWKLLQRVWDEALDDMDEDLEDDLRAALDWKNR